MCTWKIGALDVLSTLCLIHRSQSVSIFPHLKHEVEVHMGDELQLAPSLKPTAGLQGFLEELGPGLITGAADDDPSGISTYSVAGASFGMPRSGRLFCRSP